MVRNVVTIWFPMETTKTTWFQGICITATKGIVMIMDPSN